MKRFACPNCQRTFERGRSKSAHMSHCGSKRPPSRFRDVNGLLQLRFDLARVARLAGKPHGVAPSYGDYLRHGIVHPNTVMGAAGGYRQGDQRPNIGWTATVRKFGYVPAWTQRRVRRS